MKTFLLIFANFFVGLLFSQTELQKLELSQSELIKLSKKQAAFSGQIFESGTIITYVEPTISSEESKLIEQKIISYKNSGQIVLTNNDALNTNSIETIKVPLSEFSSFPLNIQKYIVSKREFYESYIKFD
jgi:hypothetical protein